MLAPLAPLPTIEATIHKKLFHFCSPEKLFGNPQHNFPGSEDPDSLFRFLPLPGSPYSNYAAPAPDK